MQGMVGGAHAGQDNTSPRTINDKFFCRAPCTVLRQVIEGRLKRFGLRHEIVEIGAFNDRHGGLSHDALAPSKRRRHTAAAPINGPPLPSEVAAMVVALESTRPQFRRTVAWMVGMNRSAESITLPPSTMTSGANKVTRLATPMPRYVPSHSTSPMATASPVRARSQIAFAVRV